MFDTSEAAKAARSPSPWHEGELNLQRYAGVAAQMDTVGRKFVRHFLLDQHREFFSLISFIAVGTVDRHGVPWATIRCGEPGFLHSPDPQTLEINAIRDPADPANEGMDDGDRVGLLGIDLITRRRNRMNGKIVRSGNDRFSVAVGDSYGNCPRYIQNRHFRFVRDPAEISSFAPVVSDQLGDRARQIIMAADTFFVASYADRENEGRQVDVSHRGGRPGFVRIDADGGLTIPDFNGNLFFNTLGNFLVNARAGLLFIDHEKGDVLQIAGRTEVILESPEIAAFEGAERLWRVIPETVVLRPDALPMRWTFAENGMSPSTLMTGSWPEADGRLRAAAKATTWRRFRIDAIVEESTTIRSLCLAPVDGEAVVPHLAGQHLPVRIADRDRFIRRSYTVSSAPSDGYYRLSVKREGTASALLHGAREGDEIETLGPAGSFTIDARERSRPAVLLAAGIGITPLLSMLRHVIHEGDRTRYRRPVWLFRSSRTFKERAFDVEIAELVERGQGSVRDVRVLSAPSSADEGSYDAAGRIDVELLKAHLPFGDHDFYLCGPASFMQALYDSLRRLNIADNRIHAEPFGPSGLKRDAGPGMRAPSAAPAATEPVRVILTKSGKEARWKPDDGPLLDLVEKRGLSPPFGCRAGHCGDCKTKIAKGAVSYPSNPSYVVSDEEALICCSVPAEGNDLFLEL